MKLKKNKNGYIHILINKCDDITLDKVSYSPLSSSKLYIYRGIKNNILIIDETQLDNIIKTELKKLTSSGIEIKRKLCELFTDLTIPNEVIQGLQQVNDIINKYLIKETATINVVSKADYFINIINDYYKMIKNIFSTNPLEESHKFLCEKRIQLLTGYFVKEFNKDIFVKILIHLMILLFSLKILILNIS